jgi:hypothetical protein
MYEALQHFQEEQLSHLIQKLLPVSTSDTIIFFASIPHKKKLSKFYNTPEMRHEYHEIKRTKSLGLGTWWKQLVIREICSSYNLRCEFLPQPDCMHTAHYRFDVRMTGRQHQDNLTSKKMPKPILS